MVFNKLLRKILCFFVNVNEPACVSDSRFCPLNAEDGVRKRARSRSRKGTWFFLGGMRSRGGITVTVGARGSPLSRVQVKEIEEALLVFYPHIQLLPHYIETRGDKDKSTSLRAQEKNDFFTREIDLLQKEGIVRMAIHSAKDLPDPLPSYLMVAAVTKSVNPFDVIVLRKTDDFFSLPSHSRIGTSSLQREKRVRALRQDLLFVDIRGTIEERLMQLENKTIDALVVAEAALVRLQLTHLNRMVLPGKSAEGQGQLACLVRKEDVELQDLLSVIDSRI